MSMCAAMVTESLDRQIARMAFFRDEVDDDIKKKMENSGNRTKVSGGLAPLTTISDCRLFLQTSTLSSLK